MEETKEITLRKASELAKNRLSEAINKKANAVISISNQGNLWAATVEMVDEVYLPEQNVDSMNDIIGIYEISLDNKGDLVSWERKLSRKRGDISKS